MKELSIEEKAKRYNEAIKVAENIHKFSSDPAEIKRMEQIFPELKESEDERIRKELLQIAKESEDSFYMVMTPNKREKLITWLEKQGENANFFNKIQIGDKVTRNRDGVLVNLSQLNRVAKPAERQGENSMGISEFLEKQGEQKPAWSEEDEIGFYDAMWAIEQARTIAKDENDMGNLWYAEHWLKSLRPQSTWKPSDEQMEALKEACDKHCEPDGLDPLYTLYQDLKKLREEKL